MSSKMITRVEGLELVLERVFDAPRELVFKVFSEAEHLKQWWGPRGWIVPFCSVDFRPGGVWHYCMKCVDEKQGDFFGMESWGKGSTMRSPTVRVLSIPITSRMPKATKPKVCRPRWSACSLKNTMGRRSW